jgi:uncharacterized protein
VSRTVPLPLLPGQQRLPVRCTECGRCCTYVAVGINAPVSPRYATDVLWYLYHENVKVSVDEDGDWAVFFMTRCRNLTDELTCEVYAERPHICRTFDDTGCEVNSLDRGRTFERPEEFLEFLRTWRPRVFARIEKRFVPPALQRGTSPP